VHETDETTPTQTAGPSRDNLASSEPELRLMLAVLEDAIARFHRGLGAQCPEQRKHVCEVRRWIGSRDAESPFSFENICSSLGIDADYLRAGLNAMCSDPMPQPERQQVLRRGCGHDDWASRRSASRHGRA